MPSSLYHVPTLLAHEGMNIAVVTYQFMRNHGCTLIIDSRTRSVGPSMDLSSAEEWKASATHDAHFVVCANVATR